MSRIVIDAREWSSSTGRYIRNLVLNLERLDSPHDYTVLLKPADMDAWQPAAANFAKLACPHPEFGLGEQLGFKRQLNKLRPDLVHFGMTQQPVLYKGQVITTVHDLTTARFRNPAKSWLGFTAKQLVYRRVIKRVARKSVVIVTGSNFVKDDLAAYAGIDPAKIVVTYEAADKIKAVVEPDAGLEDRQFILYVGRALPHKNLDRLLDAFVELKHQHPDLVLVLAGPRDPNYERLETEVHSRTIRHVIFAGRVSEGRLRWLYENCAAYVFPSLSEGFGLPGLEAMAHGAPVVASKATCLPEVYGEAARYFDPLDVPAMAAAINDVLTDQGLRSRLIQDGRRQVRRYSWHRMAQQTAKLYDGVLSGLG